MKILLSVILVVAVLAVVIVIRAQGPKELGYGVSSDDLSSLVCDKVCNGKLFPDYNDLDVWLSGNYDPAFWNPRFAEEQKGIDKIRNWAKTNLPSCPLRSEYLQWMDYYQGLLNDARSELKNKTQKKEMDDYDRKNAEQSKRIAKIPNIPTPR